MDTIDKNVIHDLVVEEMNNISRACGLSLFDKQGCGTVVGSCRRLLCDELDPPHPTPCFEPVLTCGIEFIETISHVLTQCGPKFYVECSGLGEIPCHFDPVINYRKWREQVTQKRFESLEAQVKELAGKLAANK